MTNGITKQRASNAKSAHHAIPWLRVYICAINITEKQIMHNSDSPLGVHITGNFHVCSTVHTEKWNKTTQFRTTYPLWGEHTHDHAMDSPHKGTAMRKTLIMQFLDYRFTFVSSTLCKKISNRAITWASGDFIITGNFIVSSAASKESTCSCPRVTYGISSQRASNAKSVYYTIPEFQVYICMKDKLYATVTT